MVRVQNCASQCISRSLIYTWQAYILGMHEKDCSVTTVLLFFFLPYAKFLLSKSDGRSAELKQLQLF